MQRVLSRVFVTNMFTSLHKQLRLLHRSQYAQSLDALSESEGCGDSDLDIDPTDSATRGDSTSFAGLQIPEIGAETGSDSVKEGKGSSAKSSGSSESPEGPGERKSDGRSGRKTGPAGENDPLGAWGDEEERAGEAEHLRRRLTRQWKRFLTSFSERPGR